MKKAINTKIKNLLEFLIRLLYNEAGAAETYLFSIILFVAIFLLFWIFNPGHALRD